MMQAKFTAEVIKPPRFGKKLLGQTEIYADKLPPVIGRGSYGDV